jgi:sec-independent protein translocase protein TatB
MLDFGFSEILLTSAIALVVLGPERLPKVARQVGNWMGRARLMARQLSEQLEREVNAEELLRQQINNKTDQPPLNPPLPPSSPAESLAAAAPAPPDIHHDAERTSVAAMHPVTPAPTSVDPSTPSNE